MNSSVQRIFTGIGASDTPASACAWLQDLSRQLAAAGWLARSGGADGADTAVEQGVAQAGGLMDLHLPWRGYNNRASAFFGAQPEAMRLAESVYPRWQEVSASVQRIFGSCVHQLLGAQLQRPSDLVLVWTADGCETEAERSRRTGGSAIVIVLAHRRGVPVFNLAREDGFARLAAHVAAMGVVLTAPPGLRSGAQATQAALF